MIVQAARRRALGSSPLVRVLVALAALGCGAGEAPREDPGPPPLAFDTAMVRLLAAPAETVALRVELAVTDEQKALGLMARSELPEDAGMLFLYESTQPDSSGFWMFRTRIPLDIAFLDSTGVIRAIRSMAPCDSTFAADCPSYPAGVPYRAALEVNQGFFASHGIDVGDRVLLSDTARSGAAKPVEGAAPER